MTRKDKEFMAASIVLPITALVAGLPVAITILVIFTVYQIKGEIK